MSSGFYYYAIPKTKYLSTATNHRLSDLLQEVFGSFPIQVDPDDLERLEYISRKLHEDVRPDLQPWIELLKSGNTVYIKRAGGF